MRNERKKNKGARKPLKNAEKQKTAEIKELYEDISVDKATVKRQKKEARLEKKREKKRRKHLILPLFERPIVCPPDKAGRSLPVRISGIVCRIIVILFAVFGMTYFLTDALRFHYMQTVISQFGTVSTEEVLLTKTAFLASLVLVPLIAIICLSRYARIGAGVALLGGAVTLFVTVPDLYARWYAVYATMINLFLKRMHSVNYFLLYDEIPFQSLGMSEAFLVNTATVLLTLVIALVFVPCLIRRVYILPPAIFSAAIFIAIFACNISRANWAMALILASFSALIVMATYDRLYQRPLAKNQYDTTADLIPDVDRPEMPDEVLEKAAEKAERKRLKKEAREAKRESQRDRRALRKEEDVSVDEELTDYFAQSTKKKPKKQKPPKVRLTPEEKKAKEAEEREARLEQRKHKKDVRSQVKLVRKYDRTVAHSRAATGGFAAISTFLLMIIVLFIPAMTIDRDFLRIEAIDEKLAYYREYLTAWLVGDEDMLDVFDYEGKPIHTDARSTELADRYYSGRAHLYVRTPSMNNLYLRGFVGVDYREGAWYSATPEQVDAYREVYGYDNSPEEMIRANFLRYILPELFPDLTEGEHNMKEYGYIASLYGLSLQEISMERYSGAIGSYAYLAPIYLNSLGLLQYESMEPSDLHYIHYFDGIITGREMAKGETYAGISYLINMKNKNFSHNWAKAIGIFEENYELFRMYKEGYFTDPEVNPAVIPMGNDKVIAAIPGTSCTIQTELDTSGKIMSHKIMRKNYDKWSEEELRIKLFTDYLEKMTRDERSDLEFAFDTYEAYRTFVHLTYTDTHIHVGEVSGEVNGETGESTVEAPLLESDILDALAKEIAESMLKEEEEELPSEGGEEDPENPEETPEKPTKPEEEIVYTEAEQAYLDRHAYVMAVINYMRDNLEYLTFDPKSAAILFPTGSIVESETLDPIENFLTETKKGNYIHFASALCLLLRENGIPARYVEGYVADTVRDAFERGTYVYHKNIFDHDAHAWVEVWFDGIGWMAYEATPGPLYTAMYPDEDTSSGGNHGPNSPVTDNESDEFDENYDPFEDMTEEELREYEEELLRQERLRQLRQLLVVAGILVLIVGVILLIILLAARSEKKRDALIKKAKEGTFDSDEDRRKTTLRLIDEIESLLRLYELEPKTGELRDAYADRLCEVMPTVFGLAPQIEGDDTYVPTAFTYPMDARELYAWIAEEEFGFGMSAKALKELAEYFSRLRTMKKRFLLWERRFILHYFRHKL